MAGHIFMTDAREVPRWCIFLQPEEYTGGLSKMTT